MGVPIETALRWEQKQKYDIPRRAFPPELRECVTWHFVKARTKDWLARLKEYWDPNEDEIRNNEKYRDYVRRNRTEHSSKDPEFYHDIIDSLFPWSPPQGAEYQLRRTVEECKQKRGDEFHGFMYLPSEIREMIYGFTLCRGTVIVPNSERRMRGPGNPVEHYESNEGFTYRRYDGLEQDLLEINNPRRTPIPLGLIQGVSRAVHDEVAPIYFGRNQFIFPAGGFFSPQFCNRRDVLQRDFNHAFSNRTNNAPLLRDVSYTFDMRDHPRNDYDNLYESFDIKESVDARRITPGEALQALHDQKVFGLEVDWAERIDSIKRMTLDRLVLDFGECYCIIGCCRKVEWVLDRFLHEGPPPGTDDTEENAFSSIDWLARPPLVVEVMGIVNGDEKVIAQEKLRGLRGSEVRFSETLDVQDCYI